ncbi:Conserved_hypothetical protein [Hexamita inflata]|uniref:Transmembrane protein n=1 Tax=Hexamita inflata TaxID=28002 RepID=A0AA86PET7_9EUKA|nr:Conserved hypothetical protein [Hexamita inflata]
MRHVAQKLENQIIDRSKSSIDFQAARTKLLADNQIFKRRVKDKIDIVPLFIDYNSTNNISIAEQSVKDPMQSLHEINCEIQKILLKSEFDPLLNDDPDEQLEHLNLQLLKDIRDFDQQTAISQKTIGGLTYSVLGDVNNGSQEVVHIQKPIAMSDLDVFCDAFQAVIDFLALNKQNDNICKTLDSLKAYFMYKISKKSSVDLALQDAVRELDNKCAILEQQNTVLLQKQNEDNEKIERLEYFNNTLTEQLTRNKIFLSQQEEKNNYYVQQINKLRKQLELQQQMNTSDKVVIEDFKIRYKRVQESQNKQKKQIENAHNKYLDTEARLHQEEQANSRYRNINKELEYQIESSTKQITDMQNELIALKETHNAEMEKIVLYEREAQKNSIQDLPGNEIIGIAAQTILKLSLSSANELVDLGVSGSDLQSLLQVIKCIDDSQTIAQFMSKVKQEMTIIQPVEMLQKRVQTDMTVQNIDNLQQNNKKLTQKMKKLEELDQKQITTIIEEDEKPIKKHDTSLFNDLNQIATSLDNEIIYQQSPKDSRSTSVRESTQLPQLQLFSNIQQQDQGFSAQQAFADRMQQIQVQKSVRGSSEIKYGGITFDLQQVEKQDPNQKATDKIIQVSVPQTTHNVQTFDVDLYDKLIQVGSTILDYQDQSIQTDEVDEILNVRNRSDSHQIKLKDAESSSSSVLIQQNGTHNTFELVDEPKKSDSIKNEQSDKLEELDIMQPKKSKKSSDHKSSSVSKQSLFSKDQSLPKKTTKPERRKSVVGVSKTSKPPATKIRQSVSNEKIIEKTETTKEEEPTAQNVQETKTEQSEINVPLFSGQQVNFNYLDQNYVNEERQLETLKQSKKKAKLVNNTAQTDPEEIIEYNDIDVQTEGNEDNATPIHVTQSNNSDTQKSSRKAPSAKSQLLPSNPPRPPQIVLPQVIKAEQIQVKELPEQYQKLYQVQPTPRHLLDQKPGDDSRPKNLLKYTSIYYVANTSQQIIVSQNVQSIQDQSIQTNQIQSSNTSSNTTTTTENQVTQTIQSQEQSLQSQQVSIQTNNVETQQIQQQQQQVPLQQQVPQQQLQTQQKQDSQKKVEPNNDEKQISEEMKIRLLENELKIQLQNQQEGINANNLIEKQNNMLQVQLLDLAKTKDQIEFEKMKMKQKFDEISANYQESTLLVEQLKQNVLELNDVIKNHEIELFTIRTENSRTKHYSNKETQCDEPIIVQKIDNLNIHQKFDQMIGKQQDEKAETKTETEIKDQITLNQNSQSKELIKMELAANQSEEQFHQSKQLLEIPLIKENSNLKKNAKSRSTSVSSNKQKNNKLDKINQEIINKNNEKSEQNKVLKSETNQTQTQIVESIKQNSKEVSQSSTDIKRRSKSQIESMEKLSIQGQALINSEKRRSSSTNNIKTQKLSRKPSQSAKSEQNSQQNNSPIDLLKSAEISEPKHADQREISVNEKIMESKNVMNKYKEKRVIESSNITMRLNSDIYKQRYLQKLLTAQQLDEEMKPTNLRRGPREKGPRQIFSIFLLPFFFYLYIHQEDHIQQPPTIQKQPRKINSFFSHFQKVNFSRCLKIHIRYSYKQPIISSHFRPYLILQYISSSIHNYISQLATQYHFQQLAKLIQLEYIVLQLDYLIQLQSCYKRLSCNNSFFHTYYLISCNSLVQHHIYISHSFNNQIIKCQYLAQRINKEAIVQSDIQYLVFLNLQLNAIIIILTIIVILKFYILCLNFAIIFPHLHTNVKRKQINKQIKTILTQENFIK